MANKLVTDDLLQTVLENYDTSKGTAVVDTTTAPISVEHRTYIKEDSSDSTNNQVWVKSTEMATKSALTNLSNSYIKYVSSLPAEASTDIIYGIDHSYSQSVDTKYLIQELISSYMTLTDSNLWVKDSYVTSDTITLISGTSSYSFNAVRWNATTSKYILCTYNSTSKSTTDITFDIDISTLYECKFNWSYSHKDFYIADSNTKGYTQLANMNQLEDWFIRKSQIGKSNGIATLDGNGKIPKSELNFTALNFKGTISAMPTDTNATNGDFYVVSTAFTNNEESYNAGDWLIYFNSWQHERNASVVSSVNGKLGAITLTGSDINVTFENTTDTIENTLPNVIKVKTVNGVSPDSNKDITISGKNIKASYNGGTDTELNTLLTSLGKVKSVDGSSPDANGNVSTKWSSYTVDLGTTTDTATSAVVLDGSTVKTRAIPTGLVTGTFDTSTNILTLTIN